MPQSFAIITEILSQVRLSDKLRNDVAQMVAEGGTEPLCHELYREAWEERQKNPRNAVVFGIAAAEVSFKQCVSALAPDTRWLLENVPSPPLTKMLSEYYLACL